MSDTAFDFTALETTESEPEYSPVSETPMCSVPGCSNEVAPYGGKGPRPKKCVTHKGKANASTGTRKKKSYATDYTEGVTQLLTMPAAMLGVVGQQTNNLPLIADAVAVESCAPKIAEAVNSLAQERAEVAAALDRILKAGPYAALIGAVVPMAFQILANHKVVPPGVAGTLSAEQVLGINTPKETAPDA
jgi:hypothetical protein